MTESEFPPNSRSGKDRRPRENERAEKKVERVATGRVIQRKKPLRKKLLDAFRPEDGSGFIEHTVLEILVPGFKDALADAATGAIDNALGTRSSRGRSRRGGYTSYNRMSKSRSRDRRDRDDDDDRRGRRRESRGSVDFTEIIMDSRVEAEEIVDQLFEIVSMYDVVSRRDLLSLAGEPHNHVDEDWGWTDLRGARVHKVREGYLIDLPRVEPLD